MADKEITLQLNLIEINTILTFLGDLPTKANVFPLLIKIKKQAEEQLNEQSNTESV